MYRATGPSMPHDLVHAAVESALVITDGFWGAMARGATFDGFEKVPRPATAGRACRSCGAAATR